MRSACTSAGRTLCGLAVALLVLVGCGGTEAACDRLAGVSPGVCLTDVDERQPAPAFPEGLVPVGDGDPVALDEVAGDVVVVNVWGSWCGPCRAEQPELNEVAEAFVDRGVTFVGVSIRDTPAGAAGHEREFAIPYDSWFDPASDYPAVFDSDVPRSVPATVLVDRAGNIAVTINGITSRAELTTLLDILASEPAP